MLVWSVRRGATRASKGEEEAAAASSDAVVIAAILILNFKENWRQMEKSEISMGLETGNEVLVIEQLVEFEGRLK
jgi:hypothetical protein